MGRLFALLIGINSYPDEVGRLQGCLHDNSNVRQFLMEHFADPAIEVLSDGDATYGTAQYSGFEREQAAKFACGG
jgi:hypothetical protein